MRLQLTSIKRWIPQSLVALALLCAETAAAKCGGVDYSWGADALARQHDFVVTMMLYVLYLILCDSFYCSHLFSTPDLHKNELRRGRSKERNHDGRRGVSVPDRRVNGLPGFLRIQDIVSIINNIHKTNHLISKPNKPKFTRFYD